MKLYRNIGHEILYSYASRVLLVGWFCNGILIELNLVKIVCAKVMTVHRNVGQQKKTTALMF